MAGIPCFEEQFSKLITNLKDKDKVVEVSSHFGPDKSVEDMFNYLWNSEEGNSLILPPVAETQKSEEEADRLRAEGNKCFQKKMLDKALKLYNLSIMHAPHPEVKFRKEKGADGGEETHENAGDSCYKENEYRSLSLGYANRSAIMLELEQYEKCIRDVHLALKYGYPKLLRSKLAERKSKSLIFLGRKGDACQAIEEALAQLDSLQLDESKSKSSREALCKLQKLCHLEVEIERQYNENALPLRLADASKEELLFAYQTPEAPELSQHNSSIPSLSDAVKLGYSSSQGRYLVAEKDINPGEVLVVEKAYGQVLHLDSSLRSHCSTCLRCCLNPLPCPSCPRVIFCSSNCRKNGLLLYHGQECGILHLLAALDMGKNAVLAYRLLIQTTFLQLKTLIPSYEQEKCNLPPEMLGFNSEMEPVYDSSDYRTIYHLVTNKEQRTVSDLFKRCAMAVTLVWLLKKSNHYFVNSSGEPFCPTQDDITLVGCTVFTHLMNLPCNAHSITELQVDVTQFQKSSSREIGSGAFGVLSLTNHSCNPSAARFSYGSTVILRAIRFIPKGSEVTDSYGEHYGLKQSTQRKSVLTQQYYFTCRCEPCEENWSTYLNLSAKCKLKCLVCKKKIDSKGKCVHCRRSFTDSLANGEIVQDKTSSQKDIEMLVEQGVKRYESAYQSIIKGDNSVENRESLCSVISLIDKYVDLPCKTYFEAQETLKHCFEREGSCVYRKEV